MAHALQSEGTRVVPGGVRVGLLHEVIHVHLQSGSDGRSRCSLVGGCFEKLAQFSGVRVQPVPRVRLDLHILVGDTPGVEQEGDVSEPHVLELSRRLGAVRNPINAPISLLFLLSAASVDCAKSPSPRSRARVSRTVRIEC